jgi:hypothetical protein
MKLISLNPIGVRNRFNFLMMERGCRVWHPFFVELYDLEPYKEYPKGIPLGYVLICFKEKISENLRDPRETKTI